ncbi:hypothetical protein PROFUN_01235 [Planoprotostelium fungivorum]|uniref:Vacuolar protein 14 C-terminal Fig4-binding domain-containing protein n=1 Tax=Planoprotostelium fungivorum TaxID=1890364 RepID=A0A2P6NZK1_9EUKA|nr:hypothetical protein PROFUN_01235 [Planoprotostelium fungivorum]
MESWKNSLFSSGKTLPTEKNQEGQIKEKEGEATALPPSIARNLSDRLYDKRKLGALEVEALVRDLTAQKEDDRIRTVIQHLVSNFSESPQGNARKGGLIALAASAIGLGTDIYKYIDQLIPPVLKCFGNEDSRVRYYACESLYNIAKVARQKILIYFNEIFDAICKLFADPDVNVTNGAKLLDRLIKDIVTESDQGLDVERFIGLLQERVYVTHPECRQFLIAWVMILDSVPDIDLLAYLPRFLDGLFHMLKDNTKNIRLEAETCISEFLKSIKSDHTNVDFAGFVRILLVHSVSKDEFTRCIALEWVDEFIKFGKENMLPYTPSLLGAILPGLSDESQEIKESSIRTNNSLLNLIIGVNKDIDMINVGAILQTLSNQFSVSNVPSRLAGLNWVLVLQTTSPSQLATHLDDVFPSLLSMVADPSEEVVKVDLEVLAKISSTHSEYFQKMMEFIVQSLQDKEVLLDKRTTLIVTSLCNSLSSHRIYITLSKILQTKDDVQFVTTMVQTLNLILLTSKELVELRTTLKNFVPNVLNGESQGKKEEAMELFTVLYRSWSYNASAALSLCLLTGLYRHASHLIHTFSKIEITVNVLLDLDKLVKLLESPVFLYLRLQLLQPTQTLYGLLMLLPQSPAFETLKNRLNSISTLITSSFDLSTEKVQKVDESKLGIPFDELVEHFVKMQARQALKTRRI